MKHSFSDIFLHSKTKYIICLAFAICFTSILIISDFTELEPNETLPLINYINAFSVPGLCLYCFGGFSLIGSFGAFDTFSYSFRRRGKDSLKMGYYEYINMKSEERKKGKPFPYVPYFVVGTLFILVSLILNIILISNM